MSKLFRKVLASFLIGIVLTISIAPAVKAQASPWYSQDFGSWYAKVYDTSNPQEIFGERYTAAQAQWVFYGVLSLFINKATAGNLDLGKCIVSTQATGDVSSCFSALSSFIKSVAAVPGQPNLAEDKDQSIISRIFADRDVSGITYVKNIGRKFHLVPQAQAQSPGFGYTGALGAVPEIRNMWTVVRNLSYGLFVFVILAFAFMIMFRIKISPQVVITVQSALPKIAITLVLVTFSYAIAGFLIDIMYLVIGFISLIFSQLKVAGIGDLQGISGVRTGLTPTQYFDMLTKGPAFLGSGSGVLGFMLMYWVNFILAFIVIAIVGIFQGLCGGGGAIGGSLMSGLTFIIGIIAMIVLLIILIVNFFKIVWLLAKTFLFVVLLTVFAPLQLTLGAVIPGLGIGSWIKSYASKLAVFPAVGVMFLLALWLMQLAWESVQQMQCSWGALGGVLGTSNVSSTNFTAGWPPLFGGSPQMLALLFLIASVGIFVMIPKVGDMVESFIAGKPFNYGSAIGEATNPLGIRTFGTGIAKEAFGTYIGNQLYNPREPGSGFIPETLTKVRAGLGRRGGSAGGGPTTGV